MGVSVAQGGTAGIAERARLGESDDFAGIELVAEDLDDLPHALAPVQQLVEAGGTAAKLIRIAMVIGKDRRAEVRRNPEQRHSELDDRARALRTDPRLDPVRK